MVHETWKAVLKRERHQAYQSMMALAHTQRTVLQALAIQPTGKPTAKDYLTRFNIAGSTMTKSIDVLMEKDFVRLSSDGEYEVIDPLVKGIMSERP
jgi:DNA-binding MarR family transcriptional regulator